MEELFADLTNAMRRGIVHCNNPTNSGGGGGSTASMPNNGGSVDLGGETTDDGKEGDDAAGKKEDDPTPDPLTVDINAAIQKARTDEKQKQYSKIEGLNTDLAAVRGQLSEKDKQIADLTAALAKLDGGKPSGKPSDKPEEPDPNTPQGITQDQLSAALDAATKNTMAKAEELFGGRITDLQAQNDKLQKDLQSKDLDAYRNSLISEHDSEIIPELVSGNTKEELDQSLIIAKQAFARTAEALNKQVGQSKDNARRTLPPVPNVNSGTDKIDANAGNIMGMSQEQYAKEREQLLAEASSLAKAALSNPD